MTQRWDRPSGNDEGGSLRAPGNLQGIARLTNRERQALALVATGAGNRVIARELGISERTVKAHFTSIMGKIGVCSRAEAAVFAFAHHQLLSTLPSDPDKLGNEGPRAQSRFPKVQ